MQIPFSLGLHFSVPKGWNGVVLSLLDTQGPAWGWGMARYLLTQDIPQNLLCSPKGRTCSQVEHKFWMQVPQVQYLVLPGVSKAGSSPCALLGVSTLSNKPTPYTH